MHAEILKKVLITGGTGLIGGRLTEILIQKGYVVSHLGRSAHQRDGVQSFQWDVQRGIIDLAALQNIGTIIHLAGAGINDKRWNSKRKKEILDSRVQSTRLLCESLKKVNHSVTNFICASAIGYYGFGRAEKVFKESDPPGDDFLANVTAEWEKESTTLKAVGARIVKIRIGVVLSEKGGALTEIARPIKLNVGAPLGSGDQYLSWIHIDDLCRIFVKAIQDPSMEGTYNGVAPCPVTNKAMTKAIADKLHKPLLLPPIPGFMIRLLVGEVAEIVLNGSIVSCVKIQEAGFEFEFKTVEHAVSDLLS